ncbi:MAG: macro domain-containing protein [Candidatus Omnitrophota bacterium]
MKIGDVELEIIKGDITRLDVRAVVNAANNKLLMGGGVAGAIKRVGGQSIEEEAVRLGPIGIGDAVVTSAGKLPAEYVIHAATMGMDFSTDEDKIRRSMHSALSLAEERGLESLAFPALGCGVGGFDYAACAKIMAQEVFRLVREDERPKIRKIVFVLRDQAAKDVFEKNAFSYLSYISRKSCQGPFVTVDAIIEVGDGIVLIRRSNPPFGWALPGGFVDYGESLEQAVAREAKEETGLQLYELRQFHTYSDYRRDPRFHTVSTVFAARGEGAPRAASDAMDIRVVSLAKLDEIRLAFDHRKILDDYRRKLS